MRRLVTLSTAGTTTDVESWSWPPLLKASLGLHAAAAGAALSMPDTAPWALAAVAANHAVVAATGLWPRSQWLGPNLTRLPAAAPDQTYALTLDDGPDPSTTPAVLDVLEAHGVQATFFCIAARAQQHPALLREIVARGHSVQNHSFLHRHDFSLRGPAALMREISRAQTLLTDLSGVRPHCFRAPAGLRNALLDPVLHRLNLNLVSWTRRGFDTREGDPKVVLSRLTHGLADGDILLLHDGNPHLDASGRAVVLDVLPKLLQHCRDAGLRAVTLAEAVPLRLAQPRAQADKDRGLE